MISTNALQDGFLSSLTIVNEGVVVNDFNEGLTNFLKTIASFSISRRRFHDKTIVFLKNENVNIPMCD